MTYTQSELKKQKKKVRKKPTKVIAVPVVNSPEEEARTTVKKKKVKVKKSKAIAGATATSTTVKTNLDATMDNNAIVLSSETLDSLKLFGTAKLPKIQAKPKSDSKKKLNKTLVAATVTTTKLKPKSTAGDSAGESSSSESSPHAKCKSVKTKKSETKKKQLTQNGAVVVVKKEMKQVPKSLTAIS